MNAEPRTSAPSNPEPPPPGEHGSELTGASSLDVLHERFELMTSAPRARYSPISLRTMRLGRWICIRVRLAWKDEDVTLRISDHWARVLRDQLNGVLR